jgi:hypothetical protein
LTSNLLLALHIDRYAAYLLHFGHQEVTQLVKNNNAGTNYDDHVQANVPISISDIDYHTSVVAQEHYSFTPKTIM